MAQYGSFQNFTWDALEQAKNSRMNLIRKIGEASAEAELFEKDDSLVTIEKKLKTDIGRKFRTEIMESIGDDMNTPKLIAAINSNVNSLNEESRSLLHRLEQNYLKI